MAEEAKKVVIATKCPKCQQAVRFYRPDHEGIVKITCPHEGCGHVFGVKVTAHPPTDPIFSMGTAPSGVIARLMQKKKYFFNKDKYFSLHLGPNTIGMYDPASPSDIMIEGDYTISHRSITITVEVAGCAYKYLLTVNKASNPVRLAGKALPVGTSIYIQPRQEILLGKTRLCLTNE